MKNKDQISLIIQALILFLPINIYMAGGWMMVNIQWPLFRFQQSFISNSLIFLDRDLSYIIHGQNTGLFNVAATIFWTSGTLFLLAGFIVALLCYFRANFFNRKIAAVFTIVGGILFFISALCRFNAGFGIPIGVPVIVSLGILMYQMPEQDTSADPRHLKAIRDPIFILKLSAILLYLILFMYAIIEPSDLMSLIIAGITFFVLIFLLFPLKTETRRQFWAQFLIIIVLGTLLRLWLAYAYFGNFDMSSFTTVSDIVLSGHNVYSLTPFYNYSPVWFNILGSLRIIAYALAMPFHFMVRSFLTIIDLYSLAILVLIGISEGLSHEGIIQLSMLFYLNPITYLLTGYHGQFENFALLFIIIALYFYIRFKNGNQTSKYYSWLAFTAALIIKHNTVILVTTGIINLFKKSRIILLFLGLTALLFLLTFVPYMSTGQQGIITNVFMYGGISGIYGISSFIALPQLKYLFIIGLLIYPFLIVEREIAEQFLLGTLFFLTFTTGIGIQYFVLPVVFGALRPTRWFLLYTFVTTIVILGAFENLSLAGFNSFSLNAVWICVLFWFITLHFHGGVQTLKSE